MKEAERAKERREEDMKDVILIAMCISVTDAYYYDISNDFNCLKTLLRTLSHSLFGLLSVEHKIILQLYQNIRQSVRNEKSKSQKFSIYLNLYRIMLGESWFNHLFCILLLLFEMFIVSSSRKQKKSHVSEAFTGMICKFISSRIEITMYSAVSRNVMTTPKISLII